jgi:hypothetical protein
MAEVVFDDVIIEMKVADTFYPVLCATSCQFSTNPEFIEKTSADSGTSREWMKRIEEFAASVGGLTLIHNDVALSFFYMLQGAVRRGLHDFRMTCVDPDGAQSVIVFSALIGPQTLSGSATDFANCTIELKVTGGIELTEEDPPPPGEFTEIIRADYWNFPAGQTFIDGTSVENGYSLESVEVLEVDREHIESDVVTSAPGNGQCKHNNLTGVITFNPDEPSNGETVWVIFKVIP